jgi:hypothetical protein
MNQVLLCLTAVSFVHRGSKCAPYEAGHLQEVIDLSKVIKISNKLPALYFKIMQFIACYYHVAKSVSYALPLETQIMFLKEKFY